MATLDPAGQRTGLADSWGTVTYGYDRAGRLTSAGYPDGSTEADSYDPAGNRTLITATTPLSGTAVTTNTYDAADQLSTAATAGGGQPGTTTYGYDGNGNQTGSSGPAGTTSNTFNDLNQLTRIVGPGTNLTLLYDGQGDRLRSYERGTPTWALRNEAQDLAGGLSALVWDGTTDYAYLSPGDGSAPLSSYTPATSRATYLGTDITQRVPGSVRLATDPAGATIGAGAYDAWGVARPYTGATGATQLAGLQGVVPFGYAGQQRDARPGTYAMRARRYDPTQGRFQSQDPARPQPMRPVTLDPYAYAWDVPTLLADPSGQVPEYGFVCSREDLKTKQVKKDIDGVIQGHDFAEGAYLLNRSASPFRTCEFLIPYGSRNGSRNGQLPYAGFADVVDDYRGNHSALYELEPSRKLGTIGAAIIEAKHYVDAARDWHTVGRCRPGQTVGADVRVPSAGSDSTPPGLLKETTWDGPRDFVPGLAPLAIIGPPIWRDNDSKRTGFGTWYAVVDVAVAPGVISFHIFKKDQNGDEQPHYALSYSPASLGEYYRSWVEWLGAGRWNPGWRYNSLRPAASCGAANCSWDWIDLGTAVRWVGVAAIGIGVGVLTVTAVGACVGTIVCGVGAAIGAAVIAASATAPNYARAEAAGVKLVTREVSGPDVPRRGPPTA